MFTFTLVVQAIVAAALVTVILMQRSEGGGLAGGGSPAGLMSARGASDFLTRTTAFLATAFVALSIFLAVLATFTNAPSKVDTSLSKTIPTTPPPGEAVGSGDALGAAAASMNNRTAPANSTGVPIQR